MPGEARVLYDFETPAELGTLDIRGASMGPLKDFISLDGDYATSGARALRIHVPAWQEGMRDALWMHLALSRGEGEMARYDRMVIDATNPTDADLPWLMAFQGPGAPIRFHNVLPAGSFRRFVIHLDTLTGKASAEGFSRAELVFWRPKNVVDVHVDRILLLESGDPVPPADHSKPAPQREMMAGAYAGIEPRIEALEARTRTIGKIGPGVVPYAEAWIADLREGLAQCNEPLLLERKIGRLEDILDLSVDAAALPEPAQVDGATPYTLFAVPVRPALPTIVAFLPMSNFGARPNHNMPLYNEKGVATNYPLGHPVNLWKPRKLEWADFLADYGITYTALSGFPDWEPDFEIIQHLKDQDRLGLWNLGLGYMPGVATGHFGAGGRQVLLERMDKWAYRYDRAEKLDLLDEYAFNYVADEVHADAVEAGNALLGLIHDAYPEIPFVAAGVHFMGEEQILVPDLRNFVGPERQEEWAAARAEGKQVFWYIPHGAFPDPRYPGTELESHAIEPRLLVGAMSAEHGADGFLYYQSAIWNGDNPILGGPYTDWPAITHVASYGPVSHGGGHFFDPGPDGTPWATIRAESFRDGLEDFAYFRILGETLAAVEADEALAARHKDWIQRAKHALDVPAALGDVTTYQTDPTLLEGWRKKLADTIESAPVKPVPP